MGKRNNSELRSEALKFIVVGGIGYLIDVGTFNLYMSVSTVHTGASDPYLAKSISMILAIIFTYFANSYWTFVHRRGRKRNFIQFLMFIGINLIGLTISLACIWVSRELLGFKSLLADNISANVVGVGIAMVFRFVANRAFVFPHGKDPVIP